MTRPTTSTRTPAKQAAAPAPRKRLGRPLGSKNRVKVPAPAKAAPVARPTRATSSKAAAPVAPKLNKAELEQQVIKFERTIVRLRKQNAKLKQEAREEAQNGATAALIPVTKSKPLPKRTAAATSRRSARSIAASAEETPAAATTARKPARHNPRSKTPRNAAPDVEQDLATPEEHDDKDASDDLGSGHTST